MGGDEARGRDWHYRARGHHLYLTDTIFLVTFKNAISFEENVYNKQIISRIT